MEEVNLRVAKESVKMAVVNGQSVILMGSPGIGKTEIMIDIARALNMGYLINEASSLDPCDVRGVIMPDDKGGSYFTKSPLLPKVKIHGENGLFIVDELPSGLPAVQVAFHPLFLEKRLGADKLPEGWHPMATGNYASDGAGAFNLLTALSDRVCVLNVIEDQVVWKEDYALPKGLHPIVIGLLNFRPNLLSTFKDRNKSGQGKQFATPRTHTEASKVLYYAEKESLSDAALHASLAGWVGDGVAAEYLGFAKTYRKLPDPNKIFAGKDIVPDKPDILYALCASLVSKVREQKDTAVAIERLLQYSMKLDDEFAGLMIKDAFQLYKKFLVKAPSWHTIAMKFVDEGYV